MLEPCVNQAAGLQNLALQWVPRLVAVTSHGKQQGELPLLWGLCSSWVAMGLSVVVLDAHAQETEHNPGLAQLLDNPLNRAPDDEDHSAWSVLPAAQGLARLRTSGLLASPVGELFKASTVVLLYADAASVAQLLKACRLAPLLVLPPAQASALTAYQALKQLLVAGQLRPTVANIVLETPTSMPTPPSSSAQNLMDCASNHLGYQLQALTLTASANAEHSQDQLSRLARQLLENALPLERHPIARLH